MGFFVGAGRIDGVADVDGDADVGIEGEGGGGGAAEADFFLDGGDADDGGFEGISFGRIGGEDAEGFGHDPDADAVIEGVGGDEVVAELGDAEDEGDGVADLEFVECFFVGGGADIDVEIGEVDFFGAVAFIGFHEVDGLAADDAGDGAVFGVDDDAGAGDDGEVDAADGDEVEEAFVGDVVDEEADLVDVGGEHDARGAGGVEGEEGIAVDVGADFIDVGLEEVFDDFGGALFVAGDGGGGEESGEEVEGGFLHDRILMEQQGVDAG